MYNGLEDIKGKDIMAELTVRAKRIKDQLDDIKEAVKESNKKDFGELFMYSNKDIGKKTLNQGALALYTAEVGKLIGKVNID